MDSHAIGDPQCRLFIVQFEYTTSIIVISSRLIKLDAFIGKDMNGDDGKLAMIHDLF